MSYSAPPSAGFDPLCWCFQDVVRAIIGTELLSALVKCLYLFVVIPPRKDRAEEDTALCSFQDTFTQVTAIPS